MNGQAIVRRPRLRVALNGSFIGGIETADVVSERGAISTSFHLIFRYDGAATALESSWIDAETIGISIDFGFSVGSMGDSITWTNMVSGIVDRISFDPVSSIVRLWGRDNAAKLIDKSLQESYLNHTSSDVAVALAQSCGLSADVDSTTGLIGQYYQIEHSKTVFAAYSRHGTGWDLLSELAEIEDFDLWVDGQTVHFKRRTEVDTEAFDVAFVSGRPSNQSPTLTISDINLERSTGLSGLIQVNICSWNSKKKAVVNAKYPRTISSTADVYTIIKPNLVQDQADKLARANYQQLRSRRKVLSGSMPGELSLTPRQGLRLSGTRTDWDTLYVIDRIERRLSIAHGFTQHITASSSSSETQNDE